MQGDTPEALASFENGRALLERKRKRGVSPPADLLVLARLRVTAGSTLMDLGRTPEAIESLLAAESLVGELPRAMGWNGEAQLLNAWADWRLARIYRTQYLLQRAEEYGRRSVAACEDLLRRGVRTREMYEILNGSRMVLAGVLRRQGNWQQSMDVYQKVLDDTERRALENPSSAGLQRDLARTHDIVADMIVRMPERRKEMKLHVRKAIAIAERLAALDPGDRTAQSELGQYLSSGGETLTDPQDSPEAVGYLRRALPIFEDLLKDEPNSSVFQLYGALTEAELGKHLGSAKPSRDSILWIRRGYSHMLNLVERDGNNPTEMVELLKIQRMLMNDLARTGQDREALSLAEDLIVKARSLASQTGAQPEMLKRELPRAYAAKAGAFRTLGKRNEARKWYGAAIGEWEAMVHAGISSPETEAELAEANQRAEEFRDIRDRAPLPSTGECDIGNSPKPPPSQAARPQLYVSPIKDCFSVHTRFNP